MTTLFPAGSPHESLSEAIINDLVMMGYSIRPQFFDAMEVTAMVSEAEGYWQEGDFRHAQVGRGAARKTRPEIRGDHVFWLDEGGTYPAFRDFLEFSEVLRNAVNRLLFLGLRRFECHLTRYPPGAFYRRHVDNFQGANHRILTVLLYLNAAWKPEDGGVLRLYLDHTADSQHLDIAPEAGKLVLFDASRFPHEVLPTTRTRINLTGWFCQE